MNDLPSGIVLVVAPDTVGYAGLSTRATERELSLALDDALNIGGSDFDVASTFVGALPGVELSGASAPTSTSAATPATSRSGGGSWILWIILIAIAAGAFFLFLNSREPRGREHQGSALAKAKAKAKAEVGQMLSAVANDILDMEDEVRSADNERVDRFYQDASGTYSKSSKSFEDATTAQQLLELSNDLELATWQLDSAEAILDGNEPPRRPEPRRFETPAPAPSTTGTPAERRPQVVGTSQLPSRPEYNRRPTRCSAAMGGGLMDLLSGVLASGALTRLGGGRSSRRRPRARVLPTRSRSRSTGGTATRRSPRSGGGSRKRVRGGGRRRK